MRLHKRPRLDGAPAGPRWPPGRQQAASYALRVCSPGLAALHRAAGPACGAPAGAAAAAPWPRGPSGLWSDLRCGACLRAQPARRGAQGSGRGEGCSCTAAATAACPGCRVTASSSRPGADPGAHRRSTCHHLPAAGAPGSSWTGRRARRLPSGRAPCSFDASCAMHTISGRAWHVWAPVRT